MKGTDISKAINKIKMSSYTHYNIRFQRKDNQKVNLGDYESLKEKLFSEKYQGENSKWISSAWTEIFIYNICKASNTIVLETTPIRAHYLTNALDDIRDEGVYTIWSICTYEEGHDYLEIYDNRLKENFYANCLYFYDEINLHISELDYSNKIEIENKFQKISEKIYQYKGLGKYYSHNEIHDDREKNNKKINLQNKCSLEDRNKYILNNCYKGTPNSGGDGDNNWYSDPIIWQFMDKFEKGRYKNLIQSIEFKYQNKLVRLYDKGVYHKCFMLDNWHNLDNNIFKNWIKNK